MPKWKSKKISGLMKDEWGGRIMTKSFRPRTKTYNYLIDDDRKIKKQKAQMIVLQKKFGLKIIETV